MRFVRPAIAPGARDPRDRHHWRRRRIPPTGDRMNLGAIIALIGGKADLIEKDSLNSR
jgi:hypothetical protein